MSSSTFAYSDNSILSDDMLSSSPRLDTSEVTLYDSDVDAVGEEVSEDDYWTLEEAQAAMEAMVAAEHGNGAPTPQHLGPTVAPHSNNKHIDGTELRCHNDARAVYSNENDDKKEAASVSTLPKVSYRKLLPSTSRAKNNAVVKRGLPEAESTNVSSERHGSDDMQIDSTRKIGLSRTSTNIQAHKFNGKSTDAKRGQLDLQPFYLSMPPSGRERFIDGFMQIYLSSSGSEQQHIHTRLAECRERLNVDVTPIAADKPPLPPVMAQAGFSSASDLFAPARPAVRRQTRPVNQMQQPREPAAAQVAMCNQGMSTYWQPSHGGKDVIDLTSDSSEFEESSGNAPGFQTSFPSHAPAAWDENRTVPQYESYGRGYSSAWHQTTKHSVNNTQTHPYISSYGPPMTTYVLNQFIQGSSQDGLQPSAHPLTSIPPPAVNFLSHQPPPFSSLNYNHKRPHGPGWENGRSPLRRRVVSSPGYIDSSPYASTVPTSLRIRSLTSSTFTTHVPENNDHVVETYLVSNSDGCWTCVYQCPVTGAMCNGFISSVDKRNRFRHVATHAQREEDAVGYDLLRVEDALLLNSLNKVVIECAVRDCDFSRAVWRTDRVRETHMKEAHPEIYERRRQENKKLRKKTGKTEEDKNGG